MENNYAPPQSDVTASNSSGGVSNRMLEALSSTKPWVLFVGIVVIIMAVLTLFSVVMMGMQISSAPSRMMPFILTMFAVYLVTGLASLLAGIYLIKYNSGIGRVLISRQPEHMEEALFAQKSFWKLAGIMTLIMIILIIVMIVVGVNNPRMFRML